MVYPARMVTIPYTSGSSLGNDFLYVWSSRYRAGGFRQRNRKSNGIIAECSTFEFAFFFLLSVFLLLIYSFLYFYCYSYRHT